MNEAQLYDVNSFVTLTYDNAHLPEDLSLNHRHFQLFMKRLRKANAGREIRYYMCGEYGEGRGRPHYHACLFNYTFKDRLYFKKEGETTLYTSHELNTLWPLGFSTIGDVTFQSAAYVARYCVDKITGDNAKKTYTLIDKTTGEIISRAPEYNKMSLKPGIGAGWIAKYQSDVYPHGKILVNNKMVTPPKYYDTLYGRTHEEELKAIKLERAKQADANMEDNTKPRREVKEQLAIARLKQLKRDKL